MSSANVASWGQIPGNFKSTYNNTLSIQQYQSEFLASHKVADMLRQVEGGADSRQIVADHIYANLGDNTTVNVARTTDLQLNPMNTTEKISFTAENVFSDDFDGNQVVSTINYEGLNLWWQMENLPSYLKSWQSVS